MFNSNTKYTFSREIKASTPPHLVSSEIISSGCKDTGSAIKFLEHIEVRISFRYSFRGAVQITLESPAGTTSNLLTRRNYDRKPNSKQQWTFMSVQHWGEDPIGTWRLNMSLIQDQTETGSIDRIRILLLMIIAYFVNDNVRWRLRLFEIHTCTL